MLDGTTRSWAQHDSMLVQKGILVDITVDIASCDVISNFVIRRSEVPLCGSAQSIGIDTSRDVDRFGEL